MIEPRVFPRTFRIAASVPLVPADEKSSIIGPANVREHPVVSSCRSWAYLG